jgi:hypothetical protein
MKTMTDLGISRTLALAVGWGRVQIIGDNVLVYTGNPYDKVWYSHSHSWVYNNRVFDYRDWNVIGPIAEEFDCFPSRSTTLGWYANVRCYKGVYAETPQKASALAVIQTTK